MNMFPELGRPSFTSEEFELAMAEAVRQMRAVLGMEDDDGEMEDDNE